VAYSNSFRTGLVFDNAKLILEDTRIRAATQENAALILTKDYWYGKSVTNLYRPLATFSFLFNYAVLGNGSSAAGYHWVNFALHAGNVALLYLLAVLLLGEAAPAFWVAAVWAVHPVSTEAVTNVIGRTDLLAGFGVLAALLCHVKGAAASLWRKAAWLAGLALAAVIGLFSKESAVVLLAAMAMYDFTFRSGPGWRARVPGYVAAAAACLAFFSVRQRVLAALPATLFPFADNPLVGADFWTARLTACKVMGRYLWLLVWPRHLSCDYSYNQIPLFQWRWGWEDGQALLALAVYAALALVAMRSYRSHKPVFFFVAFFLVMLAPTSNLAMPIGSIMAERFLYLPSVGFAGCLVLAVYGATGMRLLGSGRYRRVAAPVVLALVCAALAGRTFARNFDWYDEGTLWTSAVRESPGSFKTHLNLASYLAGAGEARLDDAIAEISRSLAILNGLSEERQVVSIYELAGILYRMKGERLAAAQSGVWYRKSLDTLLVAKRIDLASNQELRRENEARGKRLAISGRNTIYLELGRTYMRLSEPAHAAKAFRYGGILRPAPEFFEEMSLAWRAAGDTRQSALALIEGYLVNPTHVQFVARLAELYLQTDLRSCALKKTGGTARLDLTCPLVHDQFCAAARNAVQLYRQRGDGPNAASVRRKAVGPLGCAAEMFP
jgi:hypothetical protein